MLLITASLLGSIAGMAQGSMRPTPPDSAIEWSTIDSGGGEVSSGGEFELTGSVGQPDAQRFVAGGVFSLTGGYWEGGALAPTLRSDLNGDDVSDLEDFFLFLSGFDSTDEVADVNHDGTVDLADFFQFLSDFDVGA